MSGMTSNTVTILAMIAMMGIISGISLYYLNLGMGIINKTYNEQHDFIVKWDKRVDISNKINNSTQIRLLELANNASLIFQQQLVNEKNIIGNLTDHRMITNATFDQVKENQEQIIRLLGGNSNIK